MKVQSSGSRPVVQPWIATAILGVLLMALGASVIGASAWATIAMSWLAGLTLVAGGIVQLVHAFQIGRRWRAATRFLIAVLSIGAGLFILQSPLVGAAGITLLIAYYLLLGAAAKAVLAIGEVRAPGRGLLIFSSVISSFLGICLLVTLPFSSLVIPGTLLGVDLLLYGVYITVFSGRLREEERLSQPSDHREAA